MIAKSNRLPCRTKKPEMKPTTPRYAADGFDLRGHNPLIGNAQDLNSPLRVEEQVVVLYAGTQGYLDSIPVEDVKRYEADILAWFEGRHRDILDGIRTSGKIESEDALKAALQAFTDQFETTVTTEES